MLIRDENLEYIAREIGDRYSGHDLVEKFKKIGVPENLIIYPNTKWRMIFDVMRHYSLSPYSDNPLKILSSIIELAVHPLNFKPNSISTSDKVIADFNKRLSFDRLLIQQNKRGFELVGITTIHVGSTSTDYLVEAINFFKNEYNKVKINGLTYEYLLGNNFMLSNYDPSPDEINYSYFRKKAIQQLKDVGFIKEYTIDERTMDEMGFEIADYAICKIDESKITQQSTAPLATEAGARAVLENVVKHEHTHRFENSAQEKEINIQFSEEVKKTKTKNIFPYTIPSGTQWENIYIQFKNDEAVRVKVAGHTHDTSFADMGFADNRTGKANTQWLLLMLLAKNGGFLTASSPDAKDKYKKHKQILSDTLKLYFRIDYDPFKTYGKSEGYSIKINLAGPEPSEDFSSHSLSSEAAELFADLTK